MSNNTSSDEVKEKSAETSAPINESLIRLMTRIAMEHKAINLSQGFPNEPPPKQVLDALVRGSLGGTPDRAAVLDLLYDSSSGGHLDVLNQYSTPMGRIELRKAIAEFYERIYGYDQINPDVDITITLGATEAMASAFRTIGKPGDKILIIEPFHELYPSQCNIFYLETIFTTLRMVDYEWKIDWIELEEGMKEAVAFVLNTPHNPTGKVFTYDELERIVDMAIQYDTIIITDEIYEFMCYRDFKHYFLLKEFPQIQSKLFICNSLSKSCSATGWRVGWCIHPKQYSDYYRGVHDQLAVMAPHPMQYAAQTYFLKLDDNFFRTELSILYLSRINLLADALRKVNFIVLNPEGAYYLFALYCNVKVLNSCSTTMEAAMFMTKEVGVACVPGDNFYGKDIEEGRKYLRFAACRSMSDIEKACEKLNVLGGN